MIDWDGWAGAALPVMALALVFVSNGGAPPRSSRVEKEGGTAFLGTGLMLRAYVWIDRLAGGACRLGLAASTISWISLAMGVLSGFVAARGLLGAASWCLALSGLFDGVDGAVARKTGSASRAGAVLDSALDRYVEFSFLAGLVYLFRGRIGPQFTVLLALFGGFMVTYSTAKAEALGVTPPRGWMKRAERMVWLAGGAALAAVSGLCGWPGEWAILFAVGVVAVFGNASAIIRLRGVARSVRD
jgi:CDP-diacylglycerol--glycerol-3-phosphate 3-phosphatidyltransferase